MHTSGLMVTLTDNAMLAEAACVGLAEAGPFSIGERIGNRVAVVLETADAAEARSWHEWAAALPGVESVQVVCAYFEESDDANN